MGGRYELNYANNPLVISVKFGMDWISIFNDNPLNP